jgi:hypothetical protein
MYPKQIHRLEHRKKLSFEQGEGLAPMPSQLARGEISQEFRAALWAAIHSRLELGRGMEAGMSYLYGPWEFILRDVHVYRDLVAAAFSTTRRRNRGFVPKTKHEFSFDHDRVARVGTFSALTCAINR